MMTALAFIFGVLPLAIATGAGAGARQAVGITVVGGMIGASTIGLFIIPALFAVIERIAEWAASYKRARGTSKPAGKTHS
jgi:HAE1 family hydrophobic/amphiphilic exporter-1/multidrug efflux pump